MFQKSCLILCGVLSLAGRNFLAANTSASIQMTGDFASRGIGSQNVVFLERPLDRYTGEFEHSSYGTISVSLDQNMLRAKLNDRDYRFQHVALGRFEALTEGSDRYKWDCDFTKDTSGEIIELRMALEPFQPPVVFKRKNDLFAADYLKKFTGAFECSLFSVNISLDEGHLTATVPGQISCELKPERKQCFYVEEMPNCSLQFVDGSEGKVSELHLHHGDQTFVLKAVSEA